MYSNCFKPHLIACLFSVFLWQCNPVEIKKEAPAINDLAGNSDFMIILPEDHRTGYNWQIVGNHDPSVIQQVNEIWHGNEKGIYFHLRALAAGQTTLSFVKRKYTDTADYKSFIIRIVAP